MRFLLFTSRRIFWCHSRIARSIFVEISYINYGPVVTKFDDRGVRYLTGWLITDCRLALARPASHSEKKCAGKSRPYVWSEIGQTPIIFNHPVESSLITDPSYCDINNLTSTDFMRSVPLFIPFCMSRFCAILPKKKIQFFLFLSFTLVFSLYIIVFLEYREDNLKWTYKANSLLDYWNAIETWFEIQLMYR